MRHTASAVEFAERESNSHKHTGGCPSNRKAVALDSKEEDTAIQLALANQARHDHEQSTKTLLICIAVSIVVGAWLVLLATMWQKKLLRQYSDDYRLLAHTSLTGESAVEWMKTGFLRVFTENAANRVDTEFAAVWRDMYLTAKERMYDQSSELWLFVDRHLRSDQELLRLLLLANSTRALVQAKFDSTDSLLGHGNSSAAVAILEDHKLRMNAQLGQQVMADMAQHVDDAARDHRKFLLQVNRAAIAVTCAALVGVLLTLLLVACRLSAQRVLHGRVLVALRKCHELDQQWERVHGAGTTHVSHSMPSSPQKEAGDTNHKEDVQPDADKDKRTDDGKETEAMIKLKAATRRVRTVFIVLIVLSVLSFGSVAISLGLTRNALGNSHVFEFMSSWIQGPTLSALMSANQWIGMYSSLLLPGLYWLEQKVALMPRVILQVESVACGEADASMDQELRAAIRSVCDIVAQVDQVPECILHKLPDHLVDSSVEVYVEAIAIFQLESLALAKALPELLSPHDRQHPDVMMYLGDTGPGDITCFSCEGLYVREPECTDDFLQFLYDGRSHEDSIRSSRALMRSFPPDAISQISRNASPFLADLQQQHQQDLDRVSSALWVSLGTVSFCVLLIVVMGLVLWLQQEERERQCRTVRHEKEWSLYRILHHPRTFLMFKEFCRNNLALESPLFWQRCYEAQRSNWPVWMALELFNDFVVPGALHEINIHSVHRRAVSEALQRYVDEPDERGREGFLSKEEEMAMRRAQDDIYDLMSVNFYHDFLSSRDFQSFVQERTHLVRERMAIMQELTA